MYGGRANFLMLNENNIEYEIILIYLQFACKNIPLSFSIKDYYLAFESGLAVQPLYLRPDERVYGPAMLSLKSKTRVLSTVRNTLGDVPSALGLVA